MSTADPHPGTTGPDGPAGPPAARPTPASETRTARGSDPRSPGPPAPPGPPVPPGPRTTGIGGHALGVLVGLVLTCVALTVLALGMSRILAANGVGGEPVTLDGLGVVLVTVGGALAALVALLAVRTSTVPFTGGLVALVVGAAYLFAPGGTHRETVRLLATEQNSDALLTVLGVCLLGVPFVVGLVLLASGTAASLVRRRGIAVGSYRERTRGAPR